MFLHRALEILNGIAQTLAEIAELAGAEEYQCDHQDDEQLRYTKFSTKHFVDSIRNRRRNERSVRFRGDSS